MIEEYLRVLDAHLERITNAEIAHWDREAKSEDQGDRSVAIHMLWQLKDGITTRHLTASGVVAVWGLFESGIITYARHVANERGVSLSLQDLRGDFLEKAKKYFSDVLSIRLYKAPQDIERLRGVQLVRNAVAHGNGRLANLRPNAADRIKKLAEYSDTLSISDGYLVVSMDWVREALASVSSILTEIKLEIQKAYPHAVQPWPARE